MSPVYSSVAERGQFLLDYIDLLLREGVDEARGFRHTAPAVERQSTRTVRGRERWVVNKLRALGSWYTKGQRGGSQLRTAINHAESIGELRDIIVGHFLDGACSPEPRRRS